jgi:hypothetical protein
MPLIQELTTLLIRQVRLVWSIVGWLALASITLMGSVWVTHQLTGIPYGHMTRDPAQAMGFPIYVGYISQLGIFFWAATSAVCLLCLWALRGRPETLEYRRFFLAGALLTLVLALDDVFLIHDEVFPKMLGIPDWVLFLVLTGLTGLLVIQSFKLILRTDFLLLIVAFSFFALSIGLDLIQPPHFDPYIVEDGAKLVGILSWMVYFFRTGLQSLRPYVDRAPRIDGNVTTLQARENRTAVNIAPDTAGSKAVRTPPSSPLTR